MEFIFIPHSKDEFLLNHFFIISIINMGIKVIIVTIILVMRQYKNIKYIMKGHILLPGLHRQSIRFLVSVHKPTTSEF